MRLISLSILLIIGVVQCGGSQVEADSESSSGPVGYYSDYFVFIADDGEAPLVVPIDINWTLFEDEYEVEYKSWYGTEADWPIEYFTKKIQATPSTIPNEAFGHPKAEGFSFNEKKRTIATTIKGDHNVQIQIPEKTEWVLAKAESDFPTYAFKTDIKVDGKSRAGWMVYERIRFDKLSDFDGFAAFYWMPLVVDNNLYHFLDHKGEQTAFKWSTTEGDIKVETVPAFTFNVVETIVDEKSKRSEIAKTIRFQVPEWELDVTLASTGQQIGYGEEHPKGLAVFRQSLLQSVEQSKDVGYGMMELILAKN